jgi:hypothetical protein
MFDVYLSCDSCVSIDPSWSEDWLLGFLVAFTPSSWYRDTTEWLTSSFFRPLDHGTRVMPVMHHLRFFPLLGRIVLFTLRHRLVGQQVPSFCFCYPLVIKHGKCWEIPNPKWRCIARKIIELRMFGLMKPKVKPNFVRGYGINSY